MTLVREKNAITVGSPLPHQTFPGGKGKCSSIVSVSSICDPSDAQVAHRVGVFSKIYVWIRFLLLLTAGAVLFWPYWWFMAFLQILEKSRKSDNISTRFDKMRADHFPIWLPLPSIPLSNCLLKLLWDNDLTRQDRDSYLRRSGRCNFEVLLPPPLINIWLINCNLKLFLH